MMLRHAAWYILFVVCLIPILSTCSHVVDDEEDFVQAFKDGKPWRGVGFAISIDQGQRLITRGGFQNKRAGWEELIGFEFDFNGLGKYRIAKDDGYFSIIIGGDAVASSYYSIGSNTDLVEITDYDRENQVIRGRFSLLVKHNDFPYETINFSNGQFKAKITY